MKKDRKIKGITLVALVVTIVVLIILATISINIIFGEEEIVERVRQAKQDTANAQEEEQQTLADTANSIDGYIVGERETVTISKEQYEALRPNSISEDSLLLTAENTSKNLATFNLSAFTNTFKKKFETYFDYDSTTGELTCKKEGWYSVKLCLMIAHTGSAYVYTDLYCKVNGVGVGHVVGLCNSSSVYEYDTNNVNVYMRVGDKLSIVKNSANTAGGTVSTNNIANIAIYKL